jgi:hypothetical protein
MTGTTSTMTDDELRDALVALWENDQRGVLGSSTYHQQPVDTPQERRDQIRRAFLARDWTHGQRSRFLLRLLRDRLLTDEALEAGRDETDIRMFLSYVQPLRHPENFE